MAHEEEDVTETVTKSLDWKPTMDDEGEAAFLMPEDGEITIKHVFKDCIAKGLDPLDATIRVVEGNAVIEAKTSLSQDYATFDTIDRAMLYAVATTVVANVAGFAVAKYWPSVAEFFGWFAFSAVVLVISVIYFATDND